MKKHEPFTKTTLQCTADICMLHAFLTMVHMQSAFSRDIVGHLQSLDWTSGLDWWTGLVDWTGGLTLQIIFTLSNETHSPAGLH